MAFKAILGTYYLLYRTLKGHFEHLRDINTLFASSEIHENTAKITVKH